MTLRPWLEYKKQTTGQLLNCAETHRVDSLLCSFELGIKAKEASGVELTSEERLVLAVAALQREVNNGGFHQFFTNSSCKYVPSIVDCLKRIGAQEAAELAAKSISLLKLPQVTAEAASQAAGAIPEDDDEVLAELDACDQRYYTIGDMDEKLFEFVKTNADLIRV